MLCTRIALSALLGWSIGAPASASIPSPSVQDATGPQGAVGESALQGQLQSGSAQPLSLQDAIAYALTNNMALQRSIIESEAARYDALSTWGAFDWVFDASGSYTDSESEGNSALFGGDVVKSEDTRVDLDLTRPVTTGGQFVLHFDSQFNRTNNQFFNAPELYQDTLRVSYSQPLLRGAWSEYVTSQQRESEIAERQALENRRDARQLLIHDVEVAYWELVAALDQLAVARSALELGRSQVVREQARIRAGDGTEVDVLQARTEVATRTETLLQAENDVAQRSDDLKKLVFADRSPERWERPIQPTTALPEAVAEPDVPDWFEAFEVALTKRADLRVAKLAVDTSRVRLARAESERLHGLDLVLTASSGAVDENFAQSLGDTVDFAFPRYSVQLNYNMPVQNRTASNVERAARERLRGTQVALEEAEITALGDIRRAIREVQFRSQAVRAAEQSQTLAKAQLDAEQKRLEADLSTTFQVLEFQQTLIEALSSRSRAAAEYAKSLVGLERALGTIGELSDIRSTARR